MKRDNKINDRRRLHYIPSQHNMTPNSLDFIIVTIMKSTL